MRTITVMDRNEAGVLSFDLRDMLACVAPIVTQMNWRVRNLECTGERAKDLHDIAARGDLITGARLVAIADGVDQVIDGEFFGYGQGDALPILVLRAVDSSSWDIASSSEALLDTFRRHYVTVVDAGDMPV